MVRPFLFTRSVLVQRAPLSSPLEDKGRLLPDKQYLLIPLSCGRILFLKILLFRFPSQEPSYPPQHVGWEEHNLHPVTAGLSHFKRQPRDPASPPFLNLETLLYYYEARSCISPHPKSVAQLLDLSSIRCVLQVRCTLLEVSSWKRKCFRTPRSGGRRCLNTSIGASVFSFRVSRD